MIKVEYKDLFINEVDCAGRLRGLSPAHVEGLAASIEEYGQQTPVLVRHDKDGFKLMAGGHRMAALTALKRKIVNCKIFHGLSNTKARLVEIDENLIRHELNPLDRAVFLAERKAIYEEMYPDTKAGTAGAKARHGDANEIFSFAQATAKKLGLSKRAIQRAVKIATKISPEMRKRLNDAGYIKEGELYNLSQQKQEIHGQIIDLILDKARPEGNVKAAAHYLSGKGSVQVDETEKQYNKILEAWLVSGTAARQKFRNYLGDAK